MSAAVKVEAPLPKLKLEPVDGNDLLSTLETGSPQGVCLGMIESSLQLYEPEEFKPPIKYRRVQIDYVGEKSKDYHYFEIASLDTGKILGQLISQEAKKLEPLVRVNLVQREAVIPAQEVIKGAVTVYIIFYCHANEYNHAAENIQMYQVYLKKPVIFHPSAEYKNPYDKPIRDIKDFLNGLCNDFSKTDHLMDLWTNNQEGRKVLKGLNVSLFDHQVTGINWMIDREKNINTRGGILADMGLGKTIQTIGLMTCTAAPKSAEKRSTLIIATNALLQQWEDEIKDKSNMNFKVLIYHGPKRKKIHSLDDYDVVITTYSTMACEVGTPPLFTKNWYRVVLDEAHEIRNKTTNKSTACCTLKAQNRWCLTGTPIQNKTEDLYAILRFLKTEPVSDYPTFKKLIAQCFKGNNVEISVEKVSVIFSAIMLRRNKSLLMTREGSNIAEAMIELPPKHKEDIELPFTPEERILYDLLELKANELIPKAVKNGKTYSNALALITRLKQACNHPYLVLSKLEGKETGYSNMISKPDENLLGMERYCDLCGSDQLDGPSAFCEDCRDDMGTILESKSKKTSSSTKMTKLLEILEETQKKHPGEKTIVFSQYTSMLDLIELQLQKHNIEFCRYDGSMNTNERERSLRRLKSEEGCNVMLISLKCGSVGLNLTAANRVILMDLWWNPAIENQAIDRVHRVGQTKPVYVKRLIIEDSFEQKILAMQRKKEEEAEMLLSERKTALTMENIKFLFDLK